ncbi:MAG TPA: response regulator transcription factor [Myxococcales bacterium]|nr:response regulator transcription factor [Myxococcales bacterium]
MTSFLIVDDHAVVRSGLHQILREAFPDARFGDASSAAEALDLAARERWDIALIDLNLKGRDGLSLLEELRRGYPGTSALVVTAYPEEEFAVRCLRLGASGYVTKDSAPDELASAVRKTLSGGRYVTAALAEKLAGIVAADVGVAAHEALSNREMQVLQQVASGRTLKQIAAELNLSEKTVATYRARVAEKLQISSNVELTRYALAHKLVQ